MTSLIFRNIIRFILLIIIQVFILNQVQISGYLNPYVYVMAILLLPLKTSGFLLLTLSFILGFSIDFFCNTPGMHSSATVFMGFLRPGVIRYLSRNKELDFIKTPNLSSMGFRWFFLYTLILVAAHHILLFSVEYFRFDLWKELLFNTLMSWMFSSVLIISIAFFSFRPKQ